MTEINSLLPLVNKLKKDPSALNGISKVLHIFNDMSDTEKEQCLKILDKIIEQ